MISTPNRSLIPLAVTLMALLAPAADAALIRGPYLQIGTPESIVVRWRTDVPEDSRVRYGTSVGSLTGVVDDASMVTDHEVTLTGLTPNTVYFYEVGSTTTPLAGDDADHTFKTSLAKGESGPIRIWAIGDSGYPDPGMVGPWVRNGDAVRDAYIAFNGGVASADVFLLLGDNAYTLATDAEYQTDLFEQYPGFMRTTPAWACIGNHEGFVADSLTETGPYYDVFTLPSAGEAGGVPSGTESYYSFDHGNIHFVVMDSEDSIEDSAATETMQAWLEADLAAAEADWLIAFWHRPPYSRGLLHDSDVELNERLMRENIVPILEDFGVDMVLSGHSHHYERSYFIDGHYGLSTTFGPEHLVDGGTGNPGVDNAYEKLGKGLDPHAGAVYVVAGSASENRTGLGTHPVMAVAMETLGSFVLDVDGETATATFLNEVGAVLDTFEVHKGVACPATPTVGCTAAGRSKVAIRDDARDARDQITWRAWKMDVDAADIGAPDVSDRIDLCAYDASGKVLSAGLPAGEPRWKSTVFGARYKDKGASVVGVTKAKLKGGTGGKGVVVAKARGTHLFPPNMPLTPPVTIQVKNDTTGGCWESVFAPGDVIKNEAGRFVARN